MQSQVDVLIALIRHCRMLRMSSDVGRVRAVLDVEEDLGRRLRAAGGELPDLLPPKRQGRPAKAPKAAEVVA